MYGFLVMPLPACVGARALPAPGRPLPGFRVRPSGSRALQALSAASRSERVALGAAGSARV